MLKFTQDHEWLLVEGDTATIGITQHAQEQLGDLVFVELPKPGRSVDAGGAAAVVESVKAASDIYAPLDGEVIETNTRLVDQPELINNSPYADGWILRVRPVRPDDVDKLLDAAAYEHTLEA